MTWMATHEKWKCLLWHNIVEVNKTSSIFYIHLQKIFQKMLDCNQTLVCVKSKSYSNVSAKFRWKRPTQNKIFWVECGTGNVYKIPLNLPALGSEEGSLHFRYACLKTGTEIIFQVLVKTNLKLNSRLRINLVPSWRKIHFLQSSCKTYKILTKNSKILHFSAIIL